MYPIQVIDLNSLDQKLKVWRTENHTSSMNAEASRRAFRVKGVAIEDHASGTAVVLIVDIERTRAFPFWATAVWWSDIFHSQVH